MPIVPGLTASAEPPPRPPTLDEGPAAPRQVVATDTRRPMTRWADGIARSLAGALGRRFGRHNFRSRSRSLGGRR